MTSLADLSGRVLQCVFVWITSYCGNNDCDSNKFPIASAEDMRHVIVSFQ